MKKISGTRYSAVFPMRLHASDHSDQSVTPIAPVRKSFGISLGGTKCALTVFV